MNLGDKMSTGGAEIEIDSNIKENRKKPWLFS